MTQFKRYAIYVMPDGPLARFGASWLGWDALASASAAPPDLDIALPRPLGEITATPRKYGFHATIKPPFRLAPDTSLGALMTDMARLCEGLEPVTLDSLTLTRLGGFLALVPQGQTEALAALSAFAAEPVTRLDRHRAALTQDELDKRRAGGHLTAAQDALLLRWGYPYVLEAFRFHITLTGKLPRTEAEALAKALSPHIAPLLPHPYRIDSLCLMGEDMAGMFHLIHRYPLGVPLSRSNTATSA